MSDLSEEQQVFINKKIEEGLTDYIVIANLLFKREDLHGRSKESKLVRDYMISSGSISKKEKAKPKADPEALTAAHIEFIDSNIRTGITPKQITELLFSKELAGVSNLNVFITPQYRAVHKYIKEKHPDYLVESESAVNEKYVVPRSLSSAIKKVNKWAAQDLSEDKLTLQHRKYLEKLLTYLNSPRFVQNYDSYRSSNDKDLFEAEFVRSVWDKPDLTIDETNLYINVCMDYINLKQIDMKKNKVNEMFNDTQEQKDFTMRLTEVLKTISEEYNQCAQRIDKSLQKLNGERSKRIESHQQKNASILSLVELFQDENERKMMIQIAEMQKKVVKEEADRLETMSAWKARILGITKEDAI
jgi:hypothetical protein